MQVLSPEATKEFNEAMNPVIKTDMFTSVSLHVTPEGVLQTPLRVFDNGFITDQSGNKKLQQTLERGYKQVSLTYTGRVYKNTGVHRLVLFSFNHLWSSREDKTTVHHVNTITDDNHISNLKLISSSDNVLRFFRGLDNQDYVKSQEYQTDRINQGTVPLIHKGKLIEGYTINTMGEVYHKYYIKGRNEWKVTKLRASHASKKHHMNLVLRVADKSASLHNLMAENFLVTPEGKYKTLMIDPAIANPYQPQNLYTVPVKQFN